MGDGRTRTTRWKCIETTIFLCVRVGFSEMKIQAALQTFSYLSFNLVLAKRTARNNNTNGIGTGTCNVVEIEVIRDTLSVKYGTANEQTEKSVYWNGVEMVGNRKLEWRLN